jgi:hypothetical protein
MGVGLVCCFGFVVACSPAAPPKASNVTTAPVDSPRPVTEDDGPLSEVPAPPGVFVVGRVKSPEQSIETLGEWIHFPLPWREGLERELPALAKELDATAPVDLAITLDPASANVPEPLFAVSIGVSDLSSAVDALRASGRQVEKLGTGMHFVKLAPDLRCVISRANGKAKGRLICGEERKALDVLAPYMARTLPNEALSDDDLFLEFRAAPLRQRFGKKAHMLKVGVPIFLREVTLGNPRFDSAMADASHAVADELIALIDELSAVRVRGNLDKDIDAATTEFEIVLDGNSSWTSRTLTEQAAAAKPAPELFWTLPKDVSSAYYYAATETGPRYEPIISTLSELLRGAAEHFGAKTPAVDALVDAYQQAALSPAVLVYASGPTELDAQDPLSNLVGFHLIGVEGDDGHYQALVEQAIKVLNDPKLRKLAEQQLDEKVRHLPQVKKVTSRTAPKGAKGFELRLSSKDLEKLVPNGATELKETLGKEPLVVQLWMVQQNKRTWFALGGQTTSQKLAQVLAGSGDQSLATRAGLEPLRTEPASSAGFLTLAAYASSVEALGKADPNVKISARDVLLAMPAHGQTPILYGSRAMAVGPSLKFHARMPKAALQDLTAAVVSIAAQGGAL